MKTKHFFLSILFALTGFSLSAQNGLHFDGINDHIQTTYGGVLGSANRTFEAWVYLDAAPTSNKCILDYGTNSAGSRNTFMISGNGQVSFIAGGTNGNLTSANNVITIGQWAHVAFVLENGIGYVYLNGTQITTGNLSAVNTPSFGDNLKIGQRVSGGSIPFDGKIDEVRVWNTARTQQEISSHMNVELCGAPQGLVAYFKLNEGTAGGNNSTITTATNEVSSYNGTLNNFDLTGTTSNWVTGKTLGLGSVINNMTINECTGFSITVGPNTYNSTGIYSDTLFGGSIEGCDSIINLDLTVATISNYTQTVTLCPGESLTVGSNTYTTAGNYIDTLFGASPAGCDSIVATDLSYTTPYDETFTVYGCNNYYWDVNGETYTSSGTHTEVFQDINGCDSTITIDLNVVPLTNTVSMNEHGVLKADRSNISYQWIDCDTEMEIPGATNQEFEPTYNGSFKVVLDNGDCTDTSICLTIDNVSVKTYDNNAFSIYPNPSNGSFKVEFNSAFTGDINVTDVSGKQIFNVELKDDKFTNFNLKKLEKGIYFINIIYDSGVISSKKIIIK
ncbi:LamG-like jellyroll fold domain-containing protein [Brumimicrobium aurantiacum]|uniref:T9SS C-terminal target domain-containing protein n=1 Tax=Brumimicrobium aurantiacum TaxID=1737063 RepID=A0A3E1F2I6_9FLAO|nr:LamG-like jellyroll fold domain-containing protein [Brumimicrobium aurantiacum]RFC55969.1 T9SS C-terminal target domain-containing protein [Brumimicrobium aurantiacum]